MKKVMAMGLAAAMTLSMAACGGSGSADTTAAAADYQALIDWVSENIMDDYAYTASLEANEDALKEMTDAGCEVIDISEEDQIKMRENATSAYALIRESVGDENMDKVLATVDALEK